MRIRWEYRTKDGSEVRVFKHRRQIQIASALIFTATLAAALVCAVIATTAVSMKILVFFTGLVPFFLLLTAVPLYVLIRLQAKIVVDDECIRTVGWFHTIRIPFTEIVGSHLGRSHLEVRSKKRRIRADSMIEDIRGLTELVGRRLAVVRRSGTIAFDDGDAQQQKIFRYTASFKNFTQFLLAVCLFGSIGMIWERPEELHWGWAILLTPLLAGIPLAAWGVYRTTTAVEFLDDFLLWRRGGRTVAIPYDGIEQAIVKKVWNGFQYLDIRYNGQRRCLSGAMVPFDRLVSLLSQRTPVAWDGTWPLHFPVRMKGSSTAEQAIGVFLGLFFAALSAYMIVHSPRMDWSSLVIGAGGCAVSVALIASVTLFQLTNDTPLKLQARRKLIIFGARRFALVDLWKTSTYRARDVTDVYLRVDDSFSTTYTLVITHGERRIVLQNFGHDVPLVPLYHLLREAYCGDPRRVEDAGPVEVSQDQSEYLEHADQ